MESIEIEDFQGRNYTYYNQLIKAMSALSLPIICKQRKFKTLSVEEGEKELKELIAYVFGSDENLTSFKLREERPKISTLFDSDFVESKVDFRKHMNSKELLIVLKDIKSSNDLFTCMHEYTHFKMFTTADYVNDIKYIEFFPILIELISSYYYSKTNNSLEYNYKEEELLKYAKLEAFFMKLYLYLLDHCEFMYLPKIIQRDIKELNGYILGFVYAISVLEKYKKDKYVIEDIRDVLNGREKLECFMDEYDLSISNYSTVEPTFKLISHNS